MPTYFPTKENISKINTFACSQLMENRPADIMVHKLKMPNLIDLSGAGALISMTQGQGHRSYSFRLFSNDPPSRTQGRLVPCQDLADLCRGQYFQAVPS